MDEHVYALEKLVDAVHELVTNAGRVQERIFEAGLHLDRIQPSDVPVRNLLVTIKDDLAFKRGRDSTSVTAGLQGVMSDDDASDVARRILRLHYELEEWIYEARVR